MDYWLDKLPVLSDDPTNPAQVAIRTYGLALSLSLGPSLVPFVVSLITNKRSQRTGLAALRKVLRRELGYDGFAFAITLAIAGGSTLRRLWDSLETDSRRNDNDDSSVSYSSSTRKEDKWTRTSWLSSLNSKLTSAQKTFIANLFTSYLSILLLQAGRKRSERQRNVPRPGAIPIPYTYTPPNLNPNRTAPTPPSPTLDLTLLVLVRGIDVLFQSIILKCTTKHDSGISEEESFSTLVSRGLKEKRSANGRQVALTTKLDAFVFWACSARIMWCFFYEPERLPSTYVKWIRTLAGVDNRLLRTLRLLRTGGWSYTLGSPGNPTILTTYAKDLGFPSTWGDPLRVPAFGGKNATDAWKALGVHGRQGIGGVPCELVHGGVGSGVSLAGSCTANSGIRGARAFLEALLIYIPAHFLPVLITRPKVLLRPHRVLGTLLATLRSAAFLSTFISSYWLAVCFTRTLVLARIFPGVSHNFWDGPYGCILAGCLTCGSSIWIENGRRRGEMALYVLPRAIRACIPDRWLRSRNVATTALERLVFVLSLSTLLTAATHNPDALRGLSRWGLSFITNGPHAAFWQRRRKNFDTRPGTPTLPPVLKESETP